MIQHKTFRRRSTGRIRVLAQLPDGSFADSGFPRPMTLLELRWAGMLPKIDMNLADDEF